MTTLKPPRDLFTRILKAVTDNPSRLSMHHYHELHGHEAIRPVDIQHVDCKHCLFGWVIAMTKYAPMDEAFGWVGKGQDPMDLANSILEAGGMEKLPRMIGYADEASALRVIRKRAALEVRTSLEMAHAVN